jgi:tripartite-type tricarboxylate transporter receptor subunit TctC
MKTRLLITSIFAASLIFSSSAAVKADAVSDFYKGKTISLLIGFGVGGGYDTYSRLLARHYGNHIPGNPTVVPRNMPGSGGLKVANYTYNVAPKNGTYLGVFLASTALEPLFGGGSKAKFKTTGFNWIGNMNNEIFACGVWKTSGVKKFSDMRQKEIIFGSTGKSAVTSQHARVLQHVLGAKLRIIYGYKGTKGINLAMNRGEVNGSCGLTASTVASRWKRDIDDGNLKIIVQFGRKDHPGLGGAANAYSLVDSEDTKKALDVIFRQGEAGRPVAGTPGMPKDRLAALRAAFMATMKDPAFLKDAKKTRLTVVPSSGKELAALFESFYGMPKSVIGAAKKAIGRK